MLKFIDSLPGFFHVGHIIFEKRIIVSPFTPAYQCTDFISIVLVPNFVSRCIIAALIPLVIRDLDSCFALRLDNFFMGTCLLTIVLYLL